MGGVETPAVQQASLPYLPPRSSVTSGSASSGSSPSSPPFAWSVSPAPEQPPVPHFSSASIGTPAAPQPAASGVIQPAAQQSSIAAPASPRPQTREGTLRAGSRAPLVPELLCPALVPEPLCPALEPAAATMSPSPVIEEPAALAMSLVPWDAGPEAAQLDDDSDGPDVLSGSLETGPTILPAGNVPQLAEEPGGQQLQLLGNVADALDDAADDILYHLYSAMQGYAIRPREEVLAAIASVQRRREQVILSAAHQNPGRWSPAGWKEWLAQQPLPEWMMNDAVTAWKPILLKQNSSSTTS